MVGVGCKGSSASSHATTPSLHPAPASLLTPLWQVGEVWSWGSNQFGALGHDEAEVEEGARVEVPRVVQGESSSGIHT